MEVKKDTRFKKGNTAGVGNGRPRLTPEQKALRLTTRTQFRTLLSEYSALTIAEIKKLLREKKLPMVDMAVLQHMVTAIESGDMNRIDWTLDHIAGKPKEEINMNVRGTLENTAPLKNLTKEELLVLKKMHDKTKEKN